MGGTYRSFPPAEPYLGVFHTTSERSMCTFFEGGNSHDKQSKAICRSENISFFLYFSRDDKPGLKLLMTQIIFL